MLFGLLDALSRQRPQSPHTERIKSMNQDQVSGKIDKVTGKVKEETGKIVDDPNLTNEGRADQVKGTVKEAWGNTKEAAHKVAEDAREAGKKAS